MAFDDLDHRPETTDAATLQLPWNLLTIHERDGGTEPFTRIEIRERDDKPQQQSAPTVGAGTPFSDIIRERGDGPVRLGPRIFRGDTLPQDDSRVPIDNAGASKEFVDRMRTEIDKLPPNVRRFLASQDFRVVTGGNMAEAAPDIKDDHPRGWPEGTTFSNEDGAFRPEKRQIIVAESFKDKDGKIVSSNRAEGVLRHETGHAVDAALNNVSQSAEFKAAYDKDVAAMSAETKAKLAYLLQPDGAGTEETFAEVFAGIHGGSANSWQTDFILQSFPAVTDLVRKKIAAL